MKAPLWILTLLRRRRGSRLKGHPGGSKTVSNFHRYFGDIICHSVVWARKPTLVVVGHRGPESATNSLGALADVTHEGPGWLSSSQGAVKPGQTHYGPIMLHTTMGQGQRALCPSGIESCFHLVMPEKLIESATDNPWFKKEVVS